ncbi:MAG: isochorismate synthase [Bacteroidota bacterium]
MNAALKRISELLLQKGVAFVNYSLPGSSENSLIISFSPQKHMSLDFLRTINQSGFVIAPFNANTHSPIWFMDAAKIIDEKSNLISLENKLNSLPDAVEQSEKKLNSTSKAEYEKAFLTFKNHLDSTKLDKIILSRIVSVENNKVSPIDFYGQLLEAYPNAFTYFLQLPNREIWIGASPELLFKQDENGIHTMALAGTQSINSRKLEEIRWESKEIQEQAYVKEYILEIFESGLANIVSSETYTSQAGKLAHLRTDISVNQFVERSKCIDIIKQLHPTPAVCGIPLEESRKLILETERHERKYYTGFLGLVDTDSLSLFVNLRCMQFNNHQFALYVGGGITRNSEMEKEWDETQAKANTLISILNRLK